LSALYRQVDGVNALKEQLSRICFEALNGLRSSYFWRKSARSKAKRPRPSKTESNPYIPAHTSPSSERLPVAALDADRRFVGQRAAAGAVIFFEFFFAGRCALAFF
jgi:hypothetical protein